jgi:hypothetical protein
MSNWSRRHEDLTEKELQNRAMWRMMTGYKNVSRKANKANNSNACYDATLVNDKYICPICKAAEYGNSRTITHYNNCKNRGKQYCQKTQKAGSTKKVRRSKNRSRR